MTRTRWQQEELALISQASLSAETAYHLMQTFMIRECSRYVLLAPGLQQAQGSHLPEFESFVRGIQQDKVAVLIVE